MKEKLSKKIKILIVEDDELNIRMVQTFLNSKFKIFAARSGEEALELISKDQFDLILMDIGLKKDMNGLELTQKMRKIPNYQNTPVIALTAYALPGDKERIIQAGCSHYLSKPFTRQQLENTIESSLS